MKVGFLDTGSPHLIIFNDTIEDIDVKEVGAKIRYSSSYAEHGINVNFVSVLEEGLSLRTYERGVEDETLACGTGATATAIAAYESGLITSSQVKVEVLGGQLEISFTKNKDSYSDIYLNGPAKYVFRVV